MKAVSVYITTSNKEEANRIGKAIVEQRLAACANIFDSMHSIYWWKGKIEEEKEAVLILKTKETLVDQLTEEVKKLHSYKVPCIVAWPIINGNEAYLDWIGEVTEGS